MFWLGFESREQRMYDHLKMLGDDSGKCGCEWINHGTEREDESPKCRKRVVLEDKIVQLELGSVEGTTSLAEHRFG